jgi:transcription termination factor Rho
MPVLDRSALEASPLADLHAVASELSIDGYRRLRRAEMITAILAKQGGADAVAEADVTAGAEAEGAPQAEAEAEAAPRPRRSRARKPAAQADGDAPADEEAATAKPDTSADEDDDETAGGSGRRRGRRGGRGRSAAAREDADTGPAAEESSDEEPTVEGVVELLAGGSGFVRVSPPEPSDDDVYISSAQVKRCELVSGDRVSGPKRAPRRSERFASLIRIETINGRPASELADSVRFDDLPAAFPSDQLKLSADDPTLKTIDTVAPIGKGSRVSIVGAAFSGKTEALKRIAAVLTQDEKLSVQLVLAGARPEELTEAAREDAAVSPSATSPLGASEETVNATIEPVIDQARRLAARGSDAVVLIDSLDGASRTVARRALAAARKIVDGGSLTVIATGSAPLGGETTVIALDAVRAASARFPAVEVLASGVVRPELLVSDRAAKAIARAHADAAKPEKTEKK